MQSLLVWFHNSHCNQPMRNNLLSFGILSKKIHNCKEKAIKTVLPYLIHIYLPSHIFEVRLAFVHIPHQRDISYIPNIEVDRGTQASSIDRE